jgi:hypothetical protein
MANSRGLRWTAAVLIGVAVMAGPATAERAEPAVACPGLQSPTAADATNGASAPVLPIITGDLVPYTEAGAEVTEDFTFVEGGQPERTYGIHVTYKGLQSRLTTAPHDSGGHYPSRSPLPGETQAGVVSIVTQADGVYLVLAQSSSGSANLFAWRIGPSCTPVDAAPSQPADPVDATASYTG